MSYRRITEDQFNDEFKPVKNHLVSDASNNGAMFETYGPELEHVQQVATTEPNRVWTVVDSDGWGIASGFHLVNRLGYIITEVPAPDNVAIEVYDPDEEALDDAE